VPNNRCEASKWRISKKSLWVICEEEPNCRGAPESSRIFVGLDCIFTLDKLDPGSIIESCFVARGHRFSQGPNPEPELAWVDKYDALNPGLHGMVWFPWLARRRRAISANAKVPNRGSACLCSVVLGRPLARAPRAAHTRDGNLDVLSSTTA